MTNPQKPTPLSPENNIPTVVVISNDNQETPRIISELDMSLAGHYSPEDLTGNFNPREMPTFDFLIARLPDDPKGQDDMFHSAFAILEAQLPSAFILSRRRQYNDSFLPESITELAQDLGYQLNAAVRTPDKNAPEHIFVIGTPLNTPMPKSLSLSKPMGRMLRAADLTLFT